jgi:hypothetical protein
VRQICGVAADLVVEGECDGGPFRGRVIAVAIDEHEDDGPPAASATWLLVADDNKPSPLWVAQSQIFGQRLGR